MTTRPLYFLYMAVFESKTRILKERTLRMSACLKCSDEERMNEAPKIQWNSEYLQIDQKLNSWTWKIRPWMISSKLYPDMIRLSLKILLLVSITGSSLENKHFNNKFGGLRRDNMGHIPYIYMHIAKTVSSSSDHSNKYLIKFFYFAKSRVVQLWVKQFP